MQTYDVVIIGGGHNGLTCAAYLGMAGLKVKLLERRSMVGGAAVTEEFCPGFRNSVAAYTVSLLNPKITADLRLFEHGLKIVERRAQNFLPTLDGRYLLAAEGCTKHSIAKFSAGDAERYDAFNRALDASADVLRELVLQPPPNLTDGTKLAALMPGSGANSSRPGSASMPSSGTMQVRTRPVPPTSCCTTPSAR